MSMYYYAKLEKCEKPENFDKPGWHEIPGLYDVRVYKNPETGEEVLYVIEREF